MMMGNALVVCLSFMTMLIEFGHTQNLDRKVYQGLKQATFDDPDYHIYPSERYDVAHVYALQKMKNRLQFAKDNFMEGNKLSTDGKEKLTKFTRWLMNYDLNAYVQLTFLGQTEEIKHLDYLARSCNLPANKPADICLKDINKRLRDEAVLLIESDSDFDDIKDQLLTKFYNAPCNLRYGHEDTNYSLGDKVDPMGTRQDTRPQATQLISLTDKECEMVNEDHDVYRNPSLTKVYSSTGFEAEPAKPYRRFFTMKIAPNCWVKKPIWWDDFDCRKSGVYC